MIEVEKILMGGSNKIFVFNLIYSLSILNLALKSQNQSLTSALAETIGGVTDVD